ncbi:predicted protein [Nematostella vectensis]|uniref:Major facilitator superfamily (MFS) profile domain-containing protein n=1 Tax=Nematostella vectensis TaxID=45351 RepID=A7SEN8_NEMVE|nr:predicted protein [Nematostella vectensis]|eukprot:XP_001629883.1 predicted protein [Nematostella vectensis]
MQVACWLSFLLTLAWMGSAAWALSFAGLPVSAPLCARFGCRTIATVGVLTCALALIASSFARSLNLLYFTYGICYGAGTSLIHSSNMMFVTASFKRRRAMATGFVAAGPSLFIQGTGPMTEYVTSELGWRVMYRILSASSVILLFLEFELTNEVAETISLAHGNCPQTTADRSVGVSDSAWCARCIRVDCSFWAVPSYTIVILCITLEGFGAYTPYFHLVKHCEEVGLTSKSATSLFIHIGISSLVGRSVSGPLNDALHKTPMMLHQLSSLLISGCMLLIWLAHDYVTFSVFAVLYGFGNGVGLTTMFLLLLNTVKPCHRALAFGIGEFLHSIGCMLGPGFVGE